MTSTASVQNLRRVYEFKILATVLLWCLPLLTQPGFLMDALDLPGSMGSLLLRLLGWAYLALCVGYGFGWWATRQGSTLPGPLWVGLVSNGGACVLLLFYGATGSWAALPPHIAGLLWASCLGTALITLGLYVFGIRPGTQRWTVKIEGAR